MKTLFKYAAALILGIAFLSACSDDDETPGPRDLPVNYANIAGAWQLSEWNGRQMNDDRYFYVVIDRKADEDSAERKLTIYQNIDSNKSRCLTSTYELEPDDDLGMVIRGRYDHSSGSWNSSYVIRDLGTQHMTWIVEDDPDDISVYTRRDAVPDDILTGTRSGR